MRKHIFFSELEYVAYVASESLRLPPPLWNVHLYLTILIVHDSYFVRNGLQTPFRIGMSPNVLHFY